MTGQAESGTRPGVAARAWRRAVPFPMRRALRRRMHEIRRRRSGLPGPTGTIDHETLSPSPAGRPRFPRVADTVSVIVPTLNAGPELARHLAAIRTQEGIGEIELIVADSGSRDETRTIADAAGARILPIAAGDFDHGETRNRAAELARGDVLLMTVQDAVLLTRTAIRDLVLELHSDDRMAAVSARQVPRTDADLYGSFVVLSHYRALWPNGTGRSRRPPQPVPENGAAGGGATGRVSSNGRPANGPPVTALRRRAASAVDDVCAAIRRTAWEEIRFASTHFAEDLDFGLRAVERGWTIGLSSAVAVAHSHRRDAPYHLRRSVADRLYVAPMVGDGSVSRAAAETLEGVIGAARALVAEVEGTLAEVERDEGHGLLMAQADALRSGLDAAPRARAPTGQLAALDALLAAEDGTSQGREDVVAALRQDLGTALRWRPLGEFVRANRGAGTEEGHEFFAKLTAGVLGRALGDSLRGRADRSAAAKSLMTGV